MNTKSTKDQITTWLGDDYIEVYIQQFLADKRSRNLSKSTITFYRNQLANFNKYCEAHSVKTIQQITTQFLREYLLYLAEKGHNVGGQLCVHRAVRSFINWFWYEFEPDSKNPMAKVKPPQNDLLPLEAVKPEQFETLLALCKKDTFVGERDRAILMTLYDSGLRASELCSIRIEHLDLTSTENSSIFVLKGKGGKSRSVFIGRETRKQLRKYLRHSMNSEFLFTSRTGERMSYNTLRQILRRLCNEAGIQEVSLHSFRRAFALNALQNGGDAISISRFLGHSDLSLLKRYINQSKKDLAQKYISSIDRLRDE